MRWERHGSIIGFMFWKLRNMETNEKVSLSPRSLTILRPATLSAVTSHKFSRLLTRQASETLGTLPIFRARRCGHCRARKPTLPAVRARQPNTSILWRLRKEKKISEVSYCVPWSTYLSRSLKSPEWHFKFFMVESLHFNTILEQWTNSANNMKWISKFNQRMNKIH